MPSPLHRRNYGILSKNDPKVLPRDETRAMNILEIARTLKNKHYEIGLLWKTDNLKLPMDRELAENRIVSWEKRFERNPVVEKKYKETINQYISKCYARKLTQNEIRNTSEITDFIPHHCVLNPKKLDIVRATFDAVANVKGISLSDNLLKGPDLLNSLITILSRFCLRQYVVVADIEQMLCQTKVQILWDLGFI